MRKIKLGLFLAWIVQTQIAATAGAVCPAYLQFLQAMKNEETGELKLAEVWDTLESNPELKKNCGDRVYDIALGVSQNVLVEAPVRLLALDRLLESTAALPKEISDIRFSLLKQKGDLAFLSGQFQKSIQAFSQLENESTHSDEKQYARYKSAWARFNLGQVDESFETAVKLLTDAEAQFLAETLQRDIVRFYFLLPPQKRPRLEAIFARKNLDPSVHAAIWIQFLKALESREVCELYTLEILRPARITSPEAIGLETSLLSKCLDQIPRNPKVLQSTEMQKALKNSRSALNWNFHKAVLRSLGRTSELCTRTLDALLADRSTNRPADTLTDSSPITAREFFENCGQARQVDGAKEIRYLNSAKLGPGAMAQEFNELPAIDYLEARLKNQRVLFEAFLMEHRLVLRDTLAGIVVLKNLKSVDPGWISAQPALLSSGIEYFLGNLSKLPRARRQPLIDLWRAESPRFSSLNSMAAELVSADLIKKVNDLDEIAHFVEQATAAQQTKENEKTVHLISGLSQREWASPEAERLARDLASQFLGRLR